MSQTDFGKQRIVSLFNYGRHLSVHDIIERAFVSERKAKAVIKELRDAKQIRIRDWTRRGARGRHTPVYERGDAPDVASPVPLTEAERTSRYRENIRKDMDRLDRMLDMRRTRSRAQPVDGLANQLFPWLYAKHDTVDSELADTAQQDEMATA